jgi:protein-disulfide isomerase
MSFDGPSDERPTKNQRREAARLKARQLREDQKKKERRNRVLLQGGIVVGTLAIVAIVVLAITSSIHPAGPGPRNMASDGILIGAGMKPVTTPALEPKATPVASKPDETGTVASIRVYLDYLCPFCGQFEKTNGDQIKKWVDSGAATVEIHPISLLTSKSAGTQYSLRAANAAACVANYAPEDFYAVNQELFKNQPEEGSAGLDDKQIKKLVKSAGVTTDVSKINSCIDGTDFKSWALDATDRALTGPLPNTNVPSVTGTPTVLVNGKQYQGSLDDPKEFASFVLQAAGETYSTSTPTPTPTPAS